LTLIRRQPSRIAHEYTRTIEPARGLAAETLKLERKLKAEG
jgi:hypothetical protein